MKHILLKGSFYIFKPNDHKKIMTVTKKLIKSQNIYFLIFMFRKTRLQYMEGINTMGFKWGG